MVLRIDRFGVTLHRLHQNHLNPERGGDPSFLIEVRIAAGPGNDIGSFRQEGAERSREAMGRHGHAPGDGAGIAGTIKV